MKLRPEAIVADIERLQVSQGGLVGEQMQVIPWQWEIVEAVCIYRRIAFSVARANGKTAFVSALACSAILPDGALFVPRGEVLLVASSLKQAGIAFKHILHFLKPWTHDDAGRLKRKEWSIRNSTQSKEIEHIPTGTMLVALGSDSGRAHGYAPHFVIADEPAKWAGGGEDMYVALRTGMGKQINPKFFAIGTQSDQMEHWFQKLLRSPSPSTWTKVYAAGPDDDDFAEATIRKANPSIDYIPSVMVEIQTAIEDVHSGAMSIHAFRALHLNTGTPETEGREAIVGPEFWGAVVSESPRPREGPVAIAADLGGGTSMSAMAFYWPVTGRLEVYAAYPTEPNLIDRGKADGVDDLYERMHKRGEIVLLGKYETDNVGFVTWCLSHVKGCERIGGIVGDDYAKTKLKQAMYQVGLNPDLDIDRRRVGRGASGKEDVEAFQSEVLTRHMSVGLNLCLEHAISKAALGRDRNGNPSLDKSEQRGRIDVLQAAILAVGQGQRWRLPAEGSGLSTLYDSMLAKGEMVAAV